MAQRTCSIHGCEKRLKARTWCSAHYSRWQSTGDPTRTKSGATPRPYRSGAVCDVAECGKPHLSRGYCSTHYWRWHKTGDPLTTRSGKMSQRGRLCPVDSCGKPAAAKGYCNRHWRVQVTYSVTPEWFDEALSRGCQICGRTGAGTRYAVDHDHSCCPSARSCGKCVRGILCERCNLAIGLFRDDVDALRAAVNYLTR